MGEMLRLLCVCLCVVSAVLAQVQPAQYSALVDLYDATSGESWKDSTSWKVEDTDPCVDQWFGVECNTENTAVIGLSLASNFLAGTFPETISDLDTLVTANFQDNILTGDLPDLALITSLEQIDIGFNELDGTLPDSWSSLSSVTYLDLGNNKISGTIPESWGDLTLSTLYLNDNQLIGSLPTFLQTQPPIDNIRLENNLFDCPLPTWCSEGICAPCYDYVENVTATASPTASISFVAPSASASASPSPYPTVSTTPSITASSTVEALNSWITYTFMAILGAVVLSAIVGGILVCILRYIEVQKAKRAHEEEYEAEHHERLVQDY